MARMLGKTAYCRGWHCGCPGHTDPNADQFRRMTKRSERQEWKREYDESMSEAYVGDTSDN